MSEEMIIGVDPGKSGGIAVLGDGFVEAYKMPETEHDVWETFYVFSRRFDSVFAFVEKVASMPHQGVVSTFNFGVGYGGLRMALVAAGIPREFVFSSKWQRVFGLVFPKSMGLSPVKKKNRHKARCQELFPDVKVTHAIADALLIAEYGRRVRCGEIQRKVK